jgi:hypothetical protein
LEGEESLWGARGGDFVVSEDFWNEMVRFLKSIIPFSGLIALF